MLKPPGFPLRAAYRLAISLRSVLGYQIGRGGKLVWTDKALLRFKQRVREITRRNRGHRVQDVIDELNLYIRGWLNYYKLSYTYTKVLELSEWVRRRVRLYYWKQWSRSEAETASCKAARRVAQPATSHGPDDAIY